eukprot:5866612-Amphidinium_carterae.3
MLRMTKQAKGQGGANDDPYLDPVRPPSSPDETVPSTQPYPEAMEAQSQQTNTADDPLAPQATQGIEAEAAVILEHIQQAAGRSPIAREVYVAPPAIEAAMAVARAAVVPATVNGAQRQKRRGRPTNAEVAARQAAAAAAAAETQIPAQRNAADAPAQLVLVPSPTAQSLHAAADRQIPEPSAEQHEEDDLFTAAANQLRELEAFRAVAHQQQQPEAPHPSAATADTDMTRQRDESQQQITAPETIPEMTLVVDTDDEEDVTLADLVGLQSANQPTA